MAPRLDDDVVARIEDALRAPGAVHDRPYLQSIADTYKTTLQTIYHHKKRVDCNLRVLPRSGGPAKIVTYEMEQSVKLLLDERPWMYQDELTDFLYDAYGVNVARTTVHNVLQRIKFTRKKLKVIAAQQNQELRLDWAFQLQQFTADQIVCVDESGSDERTGDRYYGWSSSGARAVVRRWLQSRERVSVLPAYTVNGYITFSIFTGTCNGDMFEDFLIDDVLPLCNAYPAPQSVVILDNASIHHSNIDRIQEQFDRRGVLLRFLPPYSPDFNPIEESFGDLKAYIRRYYRRERQKHATYQDFLEWACIKCCSGPEAARRARAHFKNAGIREA